MRRPDLGRERRWRTDVGSSGQPPRALVVALVLACATLMTLDRSTGDSSPVDGARRAMGEVYGPVEVGAAGAVRPFVAIPEWFRSRGDMRDEIDELEAENAALRSSVNTSGYDRNKLAEYDGLTAAAGTLGYALVPARVVGMGPSQSFSSTVTIDAGASSGLSPDMTVVNNDGLVGRVLRVTRTTATVLLVIDADSVVGGRVGDSMEIGMLHGRGVLGDEGRLDLELIDQSVVPARGDSVVTWGSESGAPYVSGVPVGSISKVFANVRDGSQRAVIDPFVDFGALDLVGVVVPSGTESDRAVIEADGSLQ
ncbi:rod shape-determining protein MreC [Nocardioides sp. 503]|uniref:rod shape-determining protein MreC n=1 Tax=Nocardioides sp. 503 TaxID=2508326 RepID=UPI00106F6BDD|nr:rod shape-determining protein MreC [Nocardioides sp. 503]